MDNVIHPGPGDYSVLSLQSTHRSRAIWDGQGLTDCIRPRRLDLHLWQLIAQRPFHDRIMNYFNTSGFLGIIKVGRIQYDWALITALLERWRPETHTFHLRCGEATITLQDVEVMYGLPVDGLPTVSLSRDRTVGQWQDEMHRLTGFRPAVSHFSGKSRLSITAFQDYIREIPEITEDNPDEVVQQYFRAYLLWIVGGLLCPDKSGRYIRLNLLPLLDDVTAIGSYSWGSSILAYIYWSMCRSAMSSASDFSGYAALLQVWAWERLMPFQPIPHKPPVDLFYEFYAERWKAGVDRDAVIGDVQIYRDVLDGMASDKFIWQPYDDHIIQRLSPWCSRGRHLWMAEVPMLCDEIVEHHLPGRVLRQFGCRQDIPAVVPYDVTHFNRDMCSKLDVVFRHFLEDAIALWESRAQHVVAAEPAVGIVADNDPYMVWYRRITRTLIGNPVHQTNRGYQTFAGRHEALGRGMHRLYRLGIEMQEDENNVNPRQWGQQVVAIAVEALLAASQGTRLSFDPAYDPAASYDGGPHVNIRRGGRAPNRVRGPGRRHQRGNRADREAPVAHRLVDEDDDQRPFDVASPNTIAAMSSSTAQPASCPPVSEPDIPESSQRSAGHFSTLMGDDTSFLNLLQQIDEFPSTTEPAAETMLATQMTRAETSSTTQSDESSTNTSREDASDEEHGESSGHLEVCQDLQVQPATPPVTLSVETPSTTEGHMEVCQDQQEQLATPTVTSCIHEDVTDTARELPGQKERARKKGRLVRKDFSKERVDGSADGGVLRSKTKIRRKALD